MSDDLGTRAGHIHAHNLNNMQITESLSRSIIYNIYYYLVITQSACDEFTRVLYLTRPIILQKRDEKYIRANHPTPVVSKEATQKLPKSAVALMRESVHQMGRPYSEALEEANRRHSEIMLACLWGWGPTAQAEDIVWCMEGFMVFICPRTACRAKFEIINLTRWESWTLSKTNGIRQALRLCIKAANLIILN